MKKNFRFVEFLGAFPLFAANHCRQFMRFLGEWQLFYFIFI